MRLRDLRRFYLAGGSGIAWHYRHRRSNDLDLFSESAADLGRIERRVRKLAGSEIVSLSEATIKLELDDTVVDIVSYPYPPLEPPGPGPAGARVASPIDLGVMKLAAVARRGIRRDFWDLEVLIENGLALPTLAKAYVQRFRVSESDLYAVLRSLTYFEDAEKDAAYPEGLTPRSWAALKRFFVKLAASEARSLLEGR
jgi:hypothetical protein